MSVLPLLLLEVNKLCPPGGPASLACGCNYLVTAHFLFLESLPKEDSRAQSLLTRPQGAG